MTLRVETNHLISLIIASLLVPQPCRNKIGVRSGCSGSGETELPPSSVGVAIPRTMISSNRTPELKRPSAVATV